MCMGCMANGDFLLTSGILGAASVRVGLRRYLPGLPTWPRKVTDAETSEFVASLAPATDTNPEPPIDAVRPTATAGDGGSASATHRVLAGR